MCPRQRRPRTRGGVPRCLVRSGGVGASSPHPRGCSDRPERSRRGTDVVPAPAGVFPASRTWPAGSRSRPRTRGGVPPLPVFVSASGGSSPHPRGCSALPGIGLLGLEVVPAPAGVFRSLGSLRPSGSRRPRTRGGVPPMSVIYVPTAASSPHPRGCSRRGQDQARRVRVVPAPAGVFLEIGPHRPLPIGRPRTRGGVPVDAMLRDLADESSPHPRGCSVIHDLAVVVPTVVPAPAGVFPPPTPR